MKTDESILSRSQQIQARIPGARILRRKMQDQDELTITAQIESDERQRFLVGDTGNGGTWHTFAELPDIQDLAETMLDLMSVEECLSETLS